MVKWVRPHLGILLGTRQEVPTLATACRATKHCSAKEDRLAMTNTVRFHSQGVPRAVKSKESESRRVGAKGWGTEERHDCFTGITWKDGKVLEMTMVMFAQCECT